MGSATTETFTAEELAAEIERLQRELGMPLETAQRLAAADALDPDLYQILRRLDDLYWLQGA